jgi:hypothetical protein
MYGGCHRARQLDAASSHEASRKRTASVTVKTNHFAPRLARDRLALPRSRPAGGGRVLTGARLFLLTLGFAFQISKYERVGEKAASGDLLGGWLTPAGSLAQRIAPTDREMRWDQRVGACHQLPGKRRWWPLQPTTSFMVSGSMGLWGRP